MERSPESIIQKIGDSTFLNIYVDEQWNESSLQFVSDNAVLINTANISHIEEWMPDVDESREEELDKVWRPDKNNKFGIKIKMNDGTEYTSSEFCIYELLETIMKEES